MFEFFVANPAVKILTEDHEKIKALFDQFESAKDRAAKLEIARRALLELKINAAIKEEIFYPAVRALGGNEAVKKVGKAHHVEKLLVAELDRMGGSESDFDAKFTVLGQYVQHHIKEEENELLPKAEKAQIDFQSLAEKMNRRKLKLLADGVSAAGEEERVEASSGKGDSPAAAAKR